jgi:hypothetical protein
MPEQTQSTEARVVGALSRAGAIAGGVAAALTIAWLITMVADPPPSAGTTTAEHLRALVADEVRKSLPFVVMLPIALLLVPVWIALAARGWRAHPVAASLTVAFGLLYAPFTTTAYWLQLIVGRGIADAYGADPAAAVVAYQLFDQQSSTSFVVAIDILGYAILGLGTLAAAVMLWSDGRLGRFAATMFAISGALSIAGAAGFCLRDSLLEIGSIASGPPFLLANVAVVALLRRRTDGGPARA